MRDVSRVHTRLPALRCGAETFAFGYPEEPDRAAPGAPRQRLFSEDTPHGVARRCASVADLSAARIAHGRIRDRRRRTSNASTLATWPCASGRAPRSR